MAPSSKLNKAILIATALGLLCGWALRFTPELYSTPILYGAKLLGGLFMDLLRMIVVPLVFTSIVVGVANLQEHKQLRLVWRVTLLFFLISMSVAFILGFGAAEFFTPGAGMHLDMFAGATEKFQAQQLATGNYFQQFLHGLFQNPFHALAQGDLLAVVIGALILGLALVQAGERARQVRMLTEEVQALCLWTIDWIMKIAPLGVAALLLQLAFSQNAMLFGSLLFFIMIVLATTLFHGVVVLPIMLYAVTRRSPLSFWRGARDALLMAFATSSSAATLPVTLHCVNENFRVPKEIAQFVVPLGATLNMDGTALYEGVAALFIAQLAGIELNLSQQIIIFITAMLGAVGAPGIPSTGMLSMVLVLQSVGLPVEAIAILLPIDRILDTVRTAVNVEGDMIGSLIVAKLVAQSSSDQTESLHS